MTVPVHDVADELRKRLPGIPTKKLHKLLYYCQGHYLAVFDDVLFPETISAWDMGPVVGSLWSMERNGIQPKNHADLDEGMLNTVGYVVSRYGALTGMDLERLTHAEDPWRIANTHRGPGKMARIETEWIRAWFTGAGAVTGDEEDGIVLDADEVSEWLAGAADRLADPLRPDDIEEIRARVSAQRG